MFEDGGIASSLSSFPSSFSSEAAFTFISIFSLAATRFVLRGPF